jgi:threonyl-tRNA synthetase
MEKLVKSSITFTKSEASVEEAIKKLKDQPYKVELIRDLAVEGETTVSFYTSGGFTDLCKGPHLKTTKDIQPGSFRLTHAAGAYWRGSEKNPMLQRVYGLAFETKEELDAYIAQQEEAKKRDHRVLGPQLQLFMHSDAVGAGLPLFMPKGETIKHLLMEYMRSKEEARGYKYVSTPLLAAETLYQRSGHAQYYSEDMYSFTDKEGNRFYLKPMNCPHHHMIMEKMVTSYRDLPLKLAEGSGLYRNELSGTLTGLIRVRGPITQNDSHIYVTPNQLKKEFLDVLALFKEVYDEMGIVGYWFRLSLPDFSGKKMKFGGNREQWEKASQAIREALEEFGTPYVEAVGEAAFYGPKVDVQIKNVTGKEDSIATSQVDILVPERMGLTYIDESGQEKHPIIIHRAILGSYERFIGFLIEQTAGNFPFWLAPQQIALLPVGTDYQALAHELADVLKEKGLRVEVDDSDETVGKKIRQASLMKVPVKIVLGEKEAATKTEGWNLQLNWRQDLAESAPATLTLEEFIEYALSMNKA